MKACAKIGAFLALVILAGDTLPTRAKTIAHITIVIIVSNTALQSRNIRLALAA